MPAASSARRRYRCKICGEVVLPADMRDHLAGHSTAAESAINDPSEFFEKAEDGEPTVPSADCCND